MCLDSLSCVQNRKKSPRKTHLNFPSDCVKLENYTHGKEIKIVCGNMKMTYLEIKKSPLNLWINWKTEISYELL